MSKLKCLLVKFEKALVFQVLEQDPRADGKYEASNGFRICAGSNSSGPDIYADGEIDLRNQGKSNDLDIEFIFFESDDERDKYYRRAKEALEEWAEKASCWNEPKGEASSDDASILCF